MLILRPVQEKDLDNLEELASHLDTVNFPNDRTKIEEAIQKSIRSFSGKIKDFKKGIYQFVLEDLERRQAVGVSKIIAGHGTTEKPHFYWQISYDRRESKTIGIGLTHQVLKLGKDTKGHTEVAGIIVDPGFQGKHLGKQLFYVRFLYIALNRKKFLDQIISELLPPLDKDGKSVLWEAYGRKFTALTYQEADQLSQNNKEFIAALFPQNEIYTCLLPMKAREVIGKVGKKSQPVRHLAEKNGFQFLEQIDPFDGGPHFGSDTDGVLAVRNTQTAIATKFDPARDETDGQLGLVCDPSKMDMEFQAVQATCRVFKENGKEVIACPEEILKLLGIKPGGQISFLPYT